MTKKRVSVTKPGRFDRAYQEEIEKAAGRVGKNILECLAWLLRFTQTNLNEISRGEFIDLGYELNCLADFYYCARGYGGPFGAVGLSCCDWNGHSRFKADALALTQAILTERAFRPPMNPPSIDQIKGLQQYSAGLVTEWLQGKCLNLELSEVTVIMGHCEDADCPVVTRLADHPEDLFKHNTAFFLANGASRIRRCPECQQVFLADRKNKKSCSARCQNTAAVRRLRKAGPANKNRSMTKTPKTTARTSAKRRSS